MELTSLGLETPEGTTNGYEWRGEVEGGGVWLWLSQDGEPRGKLRAVGHEYGVEGTTEATDRHWDRAL